MTVELMKVVLFDGSKRLDQGVLERYSIPYERIHLLCILI